jgi:hypothetical protein
MTKRRKAVASILQSIGKLSSKKGKFSGWNHAQKRCDEGEKLLLNNARPFFSVGVENDALTSPEK